MSLKLMIGVIKSMLSSCSKLCLKNHTVLMSIQSHTEHILSQIPAPTLNTSIRLTEISPFPKLTETEQNIWLSFFFQILNAFSIKSKSLSSSKSTLVYYQWCLLKVLKIIGFKKFKKV